MKLAGMVSPSTHWRLMDFDIHVTKHDTPL
jgi:hypothetical protein